MVVLWQHHVEEEVNSLLVTRKQRRGEKKGWEYPLQSYTLTSHPPQPQPSASVTLVLVRPASCPRVWGIPWGEHWTCISRENEDSEEAETGIYCRRRHPVGKLGSPELADCPVSSELAFSWSPWLSPLLILSFLSQSSSHIPSLHLFSWCWPRVGGGVVSGGDPSSLAGGPAEKWACCPSLQSSYCRLPSLSLLPLLWLPALC